MNWRKPALAACLALALPACGEEAADAEATRAAASSPPAATEITQLDRNQLMRDCELGVAMQGATDEQGEILCTCTVGKLVDGKTREEFEALPDTAIGDAIKLCATETGAGEVREGG